MLALRRSRPVPRHDNASAELRLSPALLHVLRLLSAAAEGRTVCAAQWPALLPARFREGPVLDAAVAAAPVAARPIATAPAAAAIATAATAPASRRHRQRRRRSDPRRRHDTAARRPTRTETAAHDPDVGAAPPVQGVIRAVAEAVPQGARSARQGHRFECARGASVVPESARQNEEDPAQIEADGRRQQGG